LPSNGGSDVGAAGAHTTDVVAGTAGELGGSDSTGGTGGTPVTTGGSGGAAGSSNGGGAGTDPSGGAAGAIEPTCDAPEQTVVAVTADTWIDFAKPNAGHGNDKTLSVVGGAAERRALVALTLPALPDGSSLIKGSLTLHLESNEDSTLAGRRLGLHQLTHEFVEGQANWDNWKNGVGGEWTTKGGDFGPILSNARLLAGTSEGPLIFDLTQFLGPLISEQPVTLSLIVMEVGAVPAESSGLTFTSSEAAASVPALVLDYCPP
jgi:hypothetical protein